MKNSAWIFGILLLLVLGGCAETATQTDTTDAAPDETFNWNPENFADKRIIRYRVPGFDQLSADQKKLVYYLVQAGLSGRDMIWDQMYRHNLEIRKVLERIIRDWDGPRNTRDWDNFLLYAKNVFFSNGIHHHYSSDKFQPDFSREYFTSLMASVGVTLSEDAFKAIFDPEKDPKRTSFDPDQDLVLASAINFYDPDITEEEVDAYYQSVIDKDASEPVEYGLNTKLVRSEDGSVREEPWKVGGLYGPALTEVVGWLEKAVAVAESEAQANALRLLIDYYRTGDLQKWVDYNIAWTNATEGDVDFIHGFVEVYHDPKSLKGSFETIVQIKDFEASERMEKVAANAQYFEDNSPIQDEHKKEEVKGISYKVVTVAGEAGDASPSTPIGVNLPNSNWIRAEHGSKSVSLGNIIYAYEKASGSGILEEFSNDEEEIERAREYGTLASKVHTALHEVIGHASGKLEDGVGQPGETLKNYRSPLEEARADLVALYFILDPHLVELGLLPNLEVGKAEYDAYIKNGLMLQLRRIEPGKNIEQAHMRNRQMVSKWVFEKGAADGVIERVVRDGKTYYDITDYDKLRDLFGQLLREVQRIKSQGDYAAGKALIEGYGIQVDNEIHEEVLARTVDLNIPPYGGFINPRLVPVTNDSGNITDVKVEYPEDFLEQMLEYGQRYSFL